MTVALRFSLLVCVVWKIDSSISLQQRISLLLHRTVKAEIPNYSRPADPTVSEIFFFYVAVSQLPHHGSPKGTMILMRLLVSLLRDDNPREVPSLAEVSTFCELISWLMHHSFHRGTSDLKF